MNVTKGGKELYHIQNKNMCTDGSTFDVFVFADHQPNEKDLKNIYHNEFGHNCELLDEFLTSSEIYKVNAEDI